MDEETETRRRGKVLFWIIVAIVVGSITFAAVHMRPHNPSQPVTEPSSERGR